MEQGHVVVDTRDQLAFSGGHIADSYCLSLKSNYSTFSGWVRPPDRPLLLVVESPAELNDSVMGLCRVGLDNVAGYLSGGMTSWINEGLDAHQVENVSVPEFKRRLDRGEVLGVDTRLKSEWDAGRINNTVHVPAPDVRHQYEKWDSEKPIAVICSTGNRSIMAASLLRQRGFRRVINVIGGVTAWTAAGYPLVTGENH